MREAVILGGLFVVVSLEQALVLHGFPIEVVLPVAVLQMGRSPLNALLVLVVASLATTAGAWFAYEVARLGRARVTRGPTPRLVAIVEPRLRRRVALVGALRLVPVARGLVSPIAGVSGIARAPYLAWTALGNAAFAALLVGATLLVA